MRIGSSPPSSTSPICSSESPRPWRHLAALTRSSSSSADSPQTVTVHRRSGKRSPSAGGQRSSAGAIERHNASSPGSSLLGPLPSSSKRLLPTSLARARTRRAAVPAPRGRRRPGADGPTVHSHRRADSSARRHRSGGLRRAAGCCDRGAASRRADDGASEARARRQATAVGRSGLTGNAPVARWLEGWAQHCERDASREPGWNA